MHQSAIISMQYSNDHSSKCYFKMLSTKTKSKIFLLSLFPCSTLNTITNPKLTVGDYSYLAKQNSHLLDYSPFVRAHNCYLSKFSILLFYHMYMHNSIKYCLVHSSILSHYYLHCHSRLLFLFTNQ